MARTLLLFFLILHCSSTALVTCSGGGGGAAGLRMKLTHVDAKGNYTAPELVRRAVAAGRQRLAFLEASEASGGGGGGVSAPIRWATLQYVAEYLIGDPPQRVEALIDTGSDLIWTQCSTCLRKVCAKQTLPYYNSSASSSFKPVPCTDRMCAANYYHFCDLDSGCSVIASYGAGTVIGSLATEVFAFQSGTAELAFGCVTFTRIFPGALQGASGLIGLGRGRLSLVSQTGATRFSYCLTRYFHNNGASGHLFVGAAASLITGHGDGAVTTIRFVKGPKGLPFYYLPLVGLTVGKTRLPIPSTLFDLRELAPGFTVGGVIIDSGSPFTSLVQDAYQALADELTVQLNRSLVPPPDDDDGAVTDLCVSRGDVGKVVPPLVFHFSGGADLAVPAENYWAPVGKATACMAIGRGGRYSTVIGNFQQQNMHVLYDLADGELSFQPADCSTL